MIGLMSRKAGSENIMTDCKSGSARLKSGKLMPSGGRPISILNLIAVFLFTLVLPVQGAFANSVNASYSPSNSAVTANGAVTIKVVLAAGSPKVEVVSPQSLGIPVLSCFSASNAKGANLVQQTGLINFNQPANCFSLGVFTKATAGVRLAVERLASPLPEINILQNSAVISSPSFLPAPTSQAIPILPFPVFGFSAVFLMWDRKNIKNKLASGPLVLKSGFATRQLQVLRC